MVRGRGALWDLPTMRFERGWMLCSWLCEVAVIFVTNVFYQIPKGLCFYGL